MQSWSGSGNDRGQPWGSGAGQGFGRLLDMVTINEPDGPVFSGGTMKALGAPLAAFWAMEAR